MKTANVNTNLIDAHLVLLKSLNPENKLALIAKLSQSLKTKQKEKDTSWKELFGALELDQPVEDFIADLKTERNLSRQFRPL